MTLYIFCDILLLETEGGRGVESKEAFEIYSCCKNCTNYNSSKCLTCQNFNKLYDATEFIMDKFYNEYKTENNIDVEQQQDNYSFQSVFEPFEEVKEENDAIDVEVTKVE